MSPWNQGVAVVDDLIAQGRLARLHGAASGVAALMRRAGQELRTAESVLERDPQTAYIVAYDAVKHAGMALLAEQNLRPTAERSHETIEIALTAQFPGVFTDFRKLRRRRNELDYPVGEDDFAEAAESTKALAQATALVTKSQTLLDQGILTVY